MTPLKRALKSESTHRNFSQKETFFDIENHQENVYCYVMKYEATTDFLVHKLLDLRKIFKGLMFDLRKKKI